jgi:hypothetical protein
MKKISEAKPSPAKQRSMREEYRFDYAEARPNRFAGHGSEERLVVVLDSDVAKVFTSPESVNSALRALIHIVPIGEKRKSPTKQTKRKTPARTQTPR